MQLAGLLTILQVTHVEVCHLEISLKGHVKNERDYIHVKSDIGVIWKMKEWTESN